MSHNIFDSIKNIFRHSDGTDAAAFGVFGGDDITSTPNGDKAEKEAVVHDYSDERNLPVYASIKNSLRMCLMTLLNKNHDLAYVASVVDNSVVLPMPYKSLSSKSHKDPALFAEDKKFAEENFGVNLKLYQKIAPYTESRQLLYQRIRSVYPDFALNMEKKIPAEDYILYTSQLRAMRGLINDPVIDKDIPLRENLLMIQDRHAEVIDTRDFTRACAIEDGFIIAELDRFYALLRDASTEQIDALNKEDIPVYVQSPGQLRLHKGKYSAVHFADVCMENRKSRMRKYDEINLLYKKLDAHPEIRLTVKEEYDEDEK